MTKLEMLTILHEFVRDAAIMHADPSDASGCNTRYFLDQEQLMRNIGAAIEAGQGKCKYCGGPVPSASTFCEIAAFVPCEVP